MGRVKMGRWGQGAANSGRKGQTNVHELEECCVSEARVARGPAQREGYACFLTIMYECLVI
jgi:hypothetical protein